MNTRLKFLLVPPLLAAAVGVSAQTDEAYATYIMQEQWQEVAGAWEGFGRGRGATQMERS